MILYLLSEYLFKIVVVGDSGVGKSSLMTQFVEHSFPETFMPTIGIDFVWLFSTLFDCNLLKLSHPLEISDHRA